MIQFLIYPKLMASHNKVDDIREMNESVNFIASSPGKKEFLF